MDNYTIEILYTQNMTKTSIFCRFFSFDDSKRLFLSDCQNKLFDITGR